MSVPRMNPIHPVVMAHRLWRLQGFKIVFKRIGGTVSRDDLVELQRRRHRYEQLLAEHQAQAAAS